MDYNSSKFYFLFAGVDIYMIYWHLDYHCWMEETFAKEQALIVQKWNLLILGHYPEFNALKMYFPDQKAPN